MVKLEGRFWFKTALVYGLIAFGFSLIGLGIEEKCIECYQDETLPDIDTQLALFYHSIGHIAFGMMMALPLLAFRYIVASGFFAITLDGDHLFHYTVTFLEWNVLFFDTGLETLPRMGHSVTFGLIACFALMMIFGRKNYILGAIGFTAIFAHMSFDIFTHATGFPILVPFTELIFTFNQHEWIYMFFCGALILGCVKFMDWKVKKLEKELAKEKLE